ncbi:MAG: hypothetical protein E6K75_04970 [Candidatus Eisenbacteria bacterium]|uniref:Fibronectin type-III domain-containing protein n=1 Tax=Eiseniibacteriota bacterium TaxID=2212470 RepID=A0A538T564_UNCEI|nr:MAG: hypothetical protein E6K75_04970 [Candidatus Eisenbacteria bacterium]
MRTDGRHRRNMNRNSRAARVGGALLISGLLAPAAAHADAVALNWTAPGDDGDVGRARSYEMRYSENPVAAADTVAWWVAATTVGAMPAPLPAGSHETFVVVGLASGKTYYFVIRASDEVPNVSGFSNVAVKQTTGSVLLTTPANFAAGASEGVVRLTWDAVPSGGAELGYRVYRKASHDPAAALLATLPLTAASYNDSTPASGATYDFSLATYNATSESPRTALTVAVPGAVLDAAVLHGYPNPARDLVTFRLRIQGGSTSAHTRITVFDLTGHRVCLLADSVFPPGDHALTWRCTSDSGNRVAPGLYNVVVDSPSGRAFTRLAVVP